LDFSGTAGGSFGVDLPSGYTIDLNKMPRAATDPKNKVGEVQHDIAGSYYEHGTVGINSTSDGVLGYIFAADGTYVYTASIVTPASSDRIYVQFKVPIQGWTSTFNPVLSMPLVDFTTWENTYGARIGNNGSSASITSQSGGFISSVSRGSTGVVSVTFTSGFFDVTPSVTLTVENEANSDRYINIYSLSTSGFTCSVEAPTDFGYRDEPFTIVATRQGSDYRQPPQPTAAVIKPAVCIIKDVKAYNAHGDSADAVDAWDTLTLNTIEGESWFVTAFASSLFTLKPGTYKFNSWTPFYKTDNAQSRLYNITESKVQTIGTSIYNYTSENADIPSFASGVFTITANTQFKMQYRVEGTSGRIGTSAYDMSDSQSVYTTVTIEKLK